MLIIGCDFHPGAQQVAIFDKRTGEIEEKRLPHPEEAERFYRGLRVRRCGWGWRLVGTIRGSSGYWRKKRGLGRSSATLRSRMRCTSHVIGWMALLLFLEVMPIGVQAQTEAPPTETGPTDVGKNGPGSEVHRVGGRVSAPRAIDSPDPEYSERARKAKYGGTCVLWLVVDANGMPRDVKVTRALGLGLDEKATEAVRQWKFSPAMKDGVPVAVMINVEVSFRLSDEGELMRLLEKADAGNAKAQFEVSQFFLSENDAYDESRGLPYLEKALGRTFPRLSLKWGTICHRAEMTW
jgi:TonB family protein